MSQAPDWPKQSDKGVAGIFSDCLGQSGAQFIDHVPPEISLDISLLNFLMIRDICKTILAFVYSLIFNVFCIFPQFFTSKGYKDLITLNYSCLIGQKHFKFLATPSVLSLSPPTKKGNFLITIPLTHSKWILLFFLHLDTIPQKRSQISVSSHSDYDWSQTNHVTCYVREAFKRKNRKYISLLPILGGGGYPPTNIFPVIKHLQLIIDQHAQKHVKSEYIFFPIMTTPLEKIAEEKTGNYQSSLKEGGGGTPDW